MIFTYQSIQVKTQRSFTACYRMHLLAPEVSSFRSMPRMGLWSCHARWIERLLRNIIYSSWPLIKGFHLSQALLTSGFEVNILFIMINHM